jgi:hypothetical protein
MNPKNLTNLSSEDPCAASGTAKSRKLTGNKSEVLLNYQRGLACFLASTKQSLRLRALAVKLLT